MGNEDTESNSQSSCSTSIFEAFSAVAAEGFFFVLDFMWALVVIGKFSAMFSFRSRRT